jgi:hypothetical protein
VLGGIECHLPFLSNWSAPLLQASGDTIHSLSILLSAFQQRDQSYFPLHRWRPEVIPEFFMALRGEYRQQPKLVQTRSQEPGSTRHNLEPVPEIHRTAKPSRQNTTHEPQNHQGNHHSNEASRGLFSSAMANDTPFSSPSSSYQLVCREKGEVIPVHISSIVMISKTSVQQVTTFANNRRQRKKKTISPQNYSSLITPDM